jgi:hypothetical protein
MVFVSSGLHMSVDIKPWSTYAEKEGGVLAHYAKEENFEAGLTSPMYNYSKLLLMYALEEASKMALDEDGKYVWPSEHRWREKLPMLTTTPQAAGHSDQRLPRPRQDRALTFDAGELGSGEDSRADLHEPGREIA